LRQSAVVEDTDFRAPRGLDRALFHKLAGCDWLRHSEHLVISGPTGVGKSWLACALGHKACREGFSVLYRRASRLFAELATARGEGRLPRMLTMLERTRLLILDDWGPEPLTGDQRRDLLEIVDDRSEKGSLLGVGALRAGDDRMPRTSWFWLRCRTNTTTIAATISRRWHSRSGIGPNTKRDCAGVAA
jgi:DNA replication protein DnaC